VAVALDLEARKIIPLDDGTKTRLASRIVPGLSL